MQEADCKLISKYLLELLELTLKWVINKIIRTIQL